MKMLHTYLFFISILVCGISTAQENEEELEKEKKQVVNDTLSPSEEYGLRVGIDIARIIRSVVNENYEGLELQADYRFYRNFYAALELGNESLLRDEQNINAKGSGSYFRLGFDYNSYKNWTGMQNIISMGMRYGFATFDQTLNSYNVFTGSDFFPNPVRDEKIETKDLTANWIELVFGIKAELFANIYLGASVSLRRLSKEDSPDLYDNVFIPGFGRTNDISRYGVGYSYSISYWIPFAKKRK